MTSMAVVLVSLALAGWSVDAVTDQQADTGQGRAGAPVSGKAPAPPVRAFAGKILRVTASSVLVERGRAKDRYVPERAVDGDFRTCWCKGAKGHGQGEWLQIDLAAPARIRALRIYPGCGAEDRIFFANNRIAAVEAVAGDTKGLLKLADERRLQAVGFATVAPVSTLRLTIVAIQESRERPKYDDTCIGEIEADLE